MKSRRKKVWSSEEKITDAIDECRAQLNELSAETAKLEQWLRSEQMQGRAGTEEWNWKKAKTLRLNRSIERLEKKRMSKLKHTLAAFRTLPMPFVDEKVPTQ